MVCIGGETVKLQYKLLDNENGIILSRQPIVVSKEMTVSFSDAHLATTAIFETEKHETYYRELSSGVCSLDVSGITGTLKVTAVQIDDRARPLRWFCEELKLTRLDSGEILVAPNDTNIVQTVANLRLENQDIRDKLKSLSNKYDDLEDRLERIMEGYDVT